MATEARGLFVGVVRRQWGQELGSSAILPDPARVMNGMLTPRTWARRP